MVTPILPILSPAFWNGLFGICVRPIKGWLRTCGEAAEDRGKKKFSGAGGCKG